MDGSQQINNWTDMILNAAFAVHSRLGPGLLEHVYCKCLVYEIGKAGLRVRSELYIPLVYDKLLIEGAYRLDILVEETVIVEVKAVEKVHPIHHAQLLTYMRLAQKPVGLFFNFNEKRLIEGMKRMVNNL
jgi:GxxExxY protein